MPRLDERGTEMRQRRKRKPRREAEQRLETTQSRDESRRRAEARDDAEQKSRGETQTKTGRVPCNERRNARAVLAEGCAQTKCAW